MTVEQSWHVVPGGIAWSTVELLRALTSNPHLDMVGVAARHRDVPPDGLLPPVPIRHLPLSRPVLYEAWQWLRWPPIERATGPVDVVHDAGYVAPPSRAPLIATVHDLFYLTYPDHYTWHSRVVLRRGLELARRHARLVMCPSRSTMADCQDAGIEPDRLRLVQWGVSIGTVGVDDVRRIRRRYGLDRPFVLFCGTVEPRKNLRRVLEAFRALDRADLELVIVGQRGWKEDIEAALTQLEGRVRRLGFVPRADLDALYSEAALVAYPSLGEGFGFPVLEAMAHGTPVVTSAATAMEEVAGDAALLIDPLDVDAIAAAIGRLLNDRELAARLRYAARKRASMFTWARSAELAAAVYVEAARQAS